MKHDELKDILHKQFKRAARAAHRNNKDMFDGWDFYVIEFICVDKTLSNNIVNEWTRESAVVMGKIYQTNVMNVWGCSRNKAMELKLRYAEIIIGEANEAIK
ncbi:hypothetical protein V5T82_14130 [Magnetovibrio sp. PR-2]|uniref:hypothetical protein n=1 Tax=Magnetovibrio sp. PR-2 TaxID=3120356 RepID=UPI002FCE1699